MELVVGDKRRYARKKVSIEANLFILGEKGTAIPCKVVDLSRGGAQVKIAVPDTLPPEVFLIKDEAHTIYECETVWQKKQAAGLMFRDLCAHSKLQRLLDEMWREMIDPTPAEIDRPPQPS